MTGPQPGGGAPVDLLRVRMLIRAALFTGVAMFGAVIYFQHRQAGWAPPRFLPELVYVPIVATALALVGMFVLRAVWSRTTNDQQRATYMVMGWAMGEGAALAGGVYYFITDDPRYYIAGIFVLLASFMLFPINRPE